MMLSVFQPLYLLMLCQTTVQLHAALAQRAAALDHIHALEVGQGCLPASKGGLVASRLPPLTAAHHREQKNK